MSKHLDLSGRDFGRLTVLKHIGNVGLKHQYMCVCICGNECITYDSYLRSGKKRSCGCLYKESRPFANRKHGVSKSSNEYYIWERIKNRCNNKNNAAYNRYGGRGIYMCDRWSNSFESFFQDMGARPSKKHSVERINNDGPYSPENCKWATYTDQARNRSNNNVISINGVTKCVAEWSIIYDIDPKTVYRRLSSGWPKDERCLKKYSKNRYGLSDLLKDEKKHRGT